ncbi:MAG: GreA/GreB family elongation factor [Candidatus Nomurabacteria bacterium]|nr:MAG: GreA/GreB family elongation factor [Candidatus Nomurabacteria bacterium]
MRIPKRKPSTYAQAVPDTRLTEAKHTELQETLQKIKNTRARLAEEVKVLSEGGDFSENAGYAMAKGRLRGMNQRILELEDQLKRAEIIRTPRNTSEIQLGHHVTIEIEGQQKTYQILGSAEANPSQGIISQNSPIGSALMSHRVGESITYQSGAKTVTCKVIRIE